MYLARSEILKRIKKEHLIEGCDPKNVQGAGVDLSIDRLFELQSQAHLGREKRDLPQLNEISSDVFILPTRKYFLCTTRERVNMPRDLIAFILPRSTLFRCGVSLRTAVVDPGYRGVLTIGIKNEGEGEFALERGARIAQIVFAEVKGRAAKYKGKYQGGKVK